MIIYWKDRTKLIVRLLFAAAILINTSCKKENNEVGSDIIGNRSGFDVQVTDTFEVITYSSKADSVDTRFLTYYMLGQINDPVLGTSSANIITQYLYPVSGFTFNGAVIDSVVLQLRYAGTGGYYGNINTPQTFRVYEINEDLPTSLSEYFYSNRTYQHGASELGSYTGPLNLTDSVKLMVGSASFTYAPQLRIRITDPSFINKLQTAKIDTLTSPASFKSVFKGLFISAEQTGMATGTGAIAYFNFRSDNPQTALVVYYKENGVNVKYEFPVAGTNEVKANQYKQSNQPALQPAGKGTHTNTCYLQPGAGIKTRILIPSLSRLAAEKAIAVNSAKIVFKVKDTTNYTPPQRLNLWDSEMDGRRKNILDFSESATYYGGNYNAATGSYTFTINRHVQNLLTSYHKNKNDINYGLNLFVPEDFPLAANRAILDTDRTPGQEKVKLILTYTVIK